MAINTSALEESISEAQRFIKRARECVVELKEDERDYYIVGTAKSGAVRRASMDLSRALSKLRKP
jgi:hypothetical protein